ncbi:MAG: hypothetical protein NTW87_21320, partial [Planctomycetota bacterium]|nr:hypothetical protein [Planctomycetota bacterium]
MANQKRHLAVLLALAVTVTLSAAEGPVRPWEQVPAAVLAAAAGLPPEAQPQEITVARNGAIYALLPNGCEII